MDNTIQTLFQQQSLAARQELQECNRYSSNFGLVLSDSEIEELMVCHADALKASGRIEFGNGILPKLIYTFCDSPFMERETYESTLAELQDSFYYYKTEAADRYSDDELIEFMVKVFNGCAQGSVEYLAGTSLDELARNARNGTNPCEEEQAGGWI